MVTSNLGSLALYALVLNALWEYAQLTPLYTCWSEWSRWQKMLVPPAVILGDVVIVVGLAEATTLLTGARSIAPQHVAGLAVLFTLSLAAGLFFEWAARRLDLWRYKPAMPTLRVAGHDVGLVPVLQITVLPAASLLLTVLFPL